jgi:cytochrome c-type biogenesis protein CcmH
MFWLISLLVLLAAGFLTLLPLLGKDVRWKPLTLMTILLLPLAGYLLYQQVGTPRALDPAMVRATARAAEPPAEHAANTDLGALTERLRKRLETNPEDVQGWVLLGRSYKNLQNYPKAIEALETAERLSAGIPMVQVELVEAKLFASNDPKFTPEMVASLEQAVAAEPTLQKGLWLLGIAAAQAGNDAVAVDWWEKLRAQLEPGSPIEESLNQQIAEVRTRLGLSPTEETSSMPSPTVMPAAPAETPTASRTAAPTEIAGKGTEIRVELSAEASQSWPQLSAGAVPPGAILFIIARPEGAVGGPPLGVRRIDQPQFPLQLALTDADSMVPQRPISSVERLELQARLSMSGRPTSSPGDWQNAAVAVARDSNAPTTLTLDQKVE